MRIAILGYRSWAHELAETVARARTESVLWVDGFPTEADVVFAVGWSEMIAPEDYSRIPTYVLHPSPLPRYRGGSPIQHQILSGETVSAVTIFRLTDEYPEVDSGPIAWQMPYSLEGSLADILQRIATVGARGVIDVIHGIEDGTLALLPQGDPQMSTRKRRTPADSEITDFELRGAGGEWLANKIRALADPYPNAFIRTADGGRLLIREAVYEPPQSQLGEAIRHALPTFYEPHRPPNPACSCAAFGRPANDHDLTCRVRMAWQSAQTAETLDGACNCYLKGDTFKAPEQHAPGCPWRGNDFREAVYEPPKPPFEQCKWVSNPEQCICLQRGDCPWRAGR